MTPTIRTRRWRRVAAAAAAVATLAGGAGAAASALPASAATTHVTAYPHAAGSGDTPVAAGSDYLALGDSVSFGYREPTTTPAPDYADAASFVGFPEDVATALDLHMANASCPGETSASLINDTAASNGCENAPNRGTAYRKNYPLHVAYSGSQFDYGLSYLRQHPGTRLVTLMIGANDAFLCEAITKDQCASELPGVLKKLTANVATVVGAIRNKAHYTGQLVLVDYYSLDYANATDNTESQGLNQAMAAGGARYHVEIANGYTAMENAAQFAGGDTCTAGLLTEVSTGGCGVHPTVAGQDVLAQSVEQTVQK